MDRAKRVLVLEMNMGQMVEDIQIAAEGTKAVDFHGTAGGVVLSPDQSHDLMLESLKKAGASLSKPAAAVRKTAPAKKKAARKKPGKKKTAARRTGHPVTKRRTKR